MGEESAFEIILNDLHTETKDVKAAEQSYKNNGRDNGFDPVRIYINEIRNKKRLSKEEQLKLFKRLRRKDREDEKQLAESNLLLVISIASRIKRRYGPKFELNLLDMIEDGNFGLMKAVKKYDPNKINPKTNKRYEFSTYASWWIRQSIMREINKQIRLPAYIVERIQRYNKVHEEMLQESESNSPPKVEDIAKRMGYNVRKINEVAKCRNLSFVSLDSEIYDQEDSPLLRDMIAYEPQNEYDPLEEKDRYLFVKDRMDNLSLSNRTRRIAKRNKRVIIMRYGLNGKKPKTLKEVSIKLGISRERVRQIEEKTLEILRKRMPKELFL